jgi:hypothetical protein
LITFFSFHVGNLEAAKSFFIANNEYTRLSFEKEDYFVHIINSGMIFLPHIFTPIIRSMIQIKA